VFRYAESVLRQAQNLLASIEELRSGMRGRIRIFASSSALINRFPADLAAFSKNHPEIKIDLEERPTIEILEALSRNQADVGVIIRGIKTGSLQFYPYLDDRLCVV